MEVQEFAVGAQGDGDGQQQTGTNITGYTGSRRYLKIVCKINGFALHI